MSEHEEVNAEQTETVEVQEVAVTVDGIEAITEQPIVGVDANGEVVEIPAGETIIIPVDEAVAAENVAAAEADLESSPAAHNPVGANGELIPSV